MTTATQYGTVADATDAVLPGVTVTVVHQDTNASRETLTDGRGEFALPALLPGLYTLTLDLPGFNSYTNPALQLGTGQVVRQRFTLDVGQLTDSVVVLETVPLIETASAAQQESLGTLEVRELPLARRNVTGLIGLSSGVHVTTTGIAGGGNVRLNGVAEGGNAITMDGVDASANGETRGMGQYGGNSQIDVMSLEAVAEVQIIRGILPAEYGGVVGGQVNLISRSGANTPHGSLFHNHQNDAFSAINPFLGQKTDLRFNQFGGSIGGPIVPNRAFFFVAFEGYRDRSGQTVQGDVPFQPLRDTVMAALPFPETELAMSALPLPNSGDNGDGTGLFRTAKERTREDNHLIAKGDVTIAEGNLAVTFTRMRPTTVEPSFHSGPGNQRTFFNEQDRIAMQYVLAENDWVSETKFGWNRTALDRVNNFWNTQDPSRPPDEEISSPGQRLPLLGLDNLFSTPSSEILLLKYRTYNGEQKFSRIVGAHNVKVGFRWARQSGWKTNPQNSEIRFSSLDDLIANKPRSVFGQFGIPEHNASMNEFGGFIQDDWRVNDRLLLNLGLRYDYYPTIKVEQTTDVPVELYNLSPPSDLNLLDFGAPRPADSPYDSDKVNFGPRFGFAWTIDRSANTVIRGGIGVLFSPHLMATLQNLISNPFVSQNVLWNQVEVEANGFEFPVYNDFLANVVTANAGGEKSVFGIVDTNLPNPYTVQVQFNVQRSFAGDWMAEIGYIRTDGRNFPLHRYFAQAVDRETGLRVNADLLGTASGYHISSGQETVYNAVQASLRKQFANGFGWDLHYTHSTGWAYQGGGLSSPFVNGDIFASQDFFDFSNERQPLSQEARHRFASNFIYALPSPQNTGGVLSHILGGWTISGIYQQQTGLPRRVTFRSGLTRSRPDLVPGADPMLPNSRDTLLHWDRNAFVPVATHPVSRMPVRTGTANPGDSRSPGRWTVDLSLGKDFNLGEDKNLELRFDTFNAFNHVNYGNPTGNIGSSRFGVLRRLATPMRTAQVGARFSF